MDDKDPITEALTEAEARLRELSREQLATAAQDVFAELGVRVEAVLEERRTDIDRRIRPRRGVRERRRAT
jgi:hypothetical protein